jgi:hypothetical protein
MKSILYFSLYLVLTVGLTGQSPGTNESPFTITIAATQSPFNLGDPLMIHIVLKSTTRGELILPQDRHDGTRGEMNYWISVADPNGNPVPDTDYGQKLKNGHAVMSRSVTLKDLNFGDEVAEDVNLNNLVKITEPGDYVVLVERRDNVYGPLHIKSNKLVIHIAAP